MRSSRIELAEFLGTRTVSAGTVSPIVPSLTLVADSAVPHLAGEIDLSLLQVCERPVPNPPGKVFPIVHLPDHQIARRYRTPYIGLNKASSHPSTSCLLDLLLSYCEVEKMLLLHLRLAAVFLLDRWEALNRRLLRVVGYAGRIQRKVQENHHCNRDRGKGREREVFSAGPTAFHE